MIKLIPNTPLKTTIAVILGLIGTTATVVWVLTNGLRDIKQDLVDLRADLAVQQKQTWTIQDQERWVYSLDKANRFTGIQIPAIPEQYRVKNKAQ